MLSAASLALSLFALLLLRNAVASRGRALAFAAGFGLVLLLLITYYALNRLTGSGIDESVLFHLETGLKGAAIADFTGLIVLTALLVAAALVAAALGFLVIRGPGGGTGKARWLAAAGLMLAALAVNPTVLDLASLARKYGAGQAAAGQPVAVPEEYVAVDAARFDGAKKNLVLFYLESIERTYLDEAAFPGLAPNLRQLEAQALSFTDLTQVVWSSWTIAGMVASQCGIPLAGSGAGSDAFLPGATCIGDLLAAQGYDLSYMGGAPLEFAGKGTFYRSHGYASVEGAAELLGQQDDPGYESIWGIYDDSLLDLAARRFDQKAAGDGPFGLTLITVDTHNPEGGIVSDSCKGVAYGDGSNAYLNAVHCADLLAGRLIRHILASPAMDSTVLVVLSDHMARPNAAWDRLEGAARSNLFMAFGAGIEPGLVNRPGTTIDIAPTILGLLGAPTEALGYGRDLRGYEPSLLVGATPLDRLLEDQWPFLVSLWSFPQLGEGIRVDAAAGRAYLGERYVKLPVMFQLDEDLTVADVLYDMDDAATLPVKMTRMWYGNRFVWVDSCARVAMFAASAVPGGAEYCALAGSLGSPGLTAFALPDGVVLSRDRLAGVFDGMVPDEAYHAAMIDEFRARAMLVDAEVVRSLNPTGLVGNFVVRSAGGADALESWIVNRDHGDRVWMQRGLTLLGLRPNAAPVKLAYADSCGWGGVGTDPDALYDTDFATALDRADGQYGAFAIVAHSSVVCYHIDPGLKALLGGLALPELRRIWYEQPYVAVLSGNGHVEEFVGERGTALALELRDFVRRDAAPVVRRTPATGAPTALPPVFR